MDTECACVREEFSTLQICVYCMFRSKQTKVLLLFDIVQINDVCQIFISSLAIICIYRRKVFSASSICLHFECFNDKRYLVKKKVPKRQMTNYNKTLVEGS